MEIDKYANEEKRVNAMFYRISHSDEFSGFLDYLQDLIERYTARLCRERDLADFRFVQGQIAALESLVEQLRSNNKA